MRCFKDLKNKLIFLENKKSYNQLCSGQGDECDSLSGLSCQSSSIGKICLLAEF